MVTYHSSGDRIYVRQKLRHLRLRQIYQPLIEVWQEGKQRFVSLQYVIGSLLKITSSNMQLEPDLQACALFEQISCLFHTAHDCPRCIVADVSMANDRRTLPRSAMFKKHVFESLPRSFCETPTICAVQRCVRG